MIFTGHAQLTIDAKQRMQIPAKFRALLNPERDGSSLVCVPWIDRKIMVFTESRFLALAERGLASLAPKPEEAAAQAGYFGVAERAELDSAGRIAVPKIHMELAKVGHEVVLVGAGPRMEIWNAEDWHKDLAERFRNIPELMRNLESRATNT